MPGHIRPVLSRIFRLDKAGEPQPVQIVSVRRDGSFELNYHGLSKILTQDDVRNRRPVVISIAGASRQGKSFLLNYFLRYMDYTYDALLRGFNWIGCVDRTLDGFSWSNDALQETIGIVMWSKAYRTTLSNGEEVAIFFIDTQGVWDDVTPNRESTMIFSMSALLSSVQIYNVKTNIKEQHVDNLRLLMEYGYLFADLTGGNPPLQRLQFLVRDWPFPYDAAYGAVGGEEMINDEFRFRRTNCSPTQSIRARLSCFSDVNCYLMPPPGEEAVCDQFFLGRVRELDQQFIFHLKQFIPKIVSHENLVLKKINMQLITSNDLLYYAKYYMDIFNVKTIPDPSRILSATTGANNMNAALHAKRRYYLLMECFTDFKQPAVSEGTLYVDHYKCKHNALTFFQDLPKLGPPEVSEMYKKWLNNELDGAYVQIKYINDKKRALNQKYRTYIVLLLYALFCYVIFGIVRFTGMEILTISLDVGVVALLMFAGIWWYNLIATVFPDISEDINGIANFIIEDLLKPIGRIFIRVNGPRRPGLNLRVRSLTSTAPVFIPPLISPSTNPQPMPIPPTSPPNDPPTADTLPPPNDPPTHMFDALSPLNDRQQ